YTTLTSLCYRSPNMDRSPICVAIVDDDESVRKALKRLLRAANLNAETFASGQEFLAAVASSCPDCIVLDVHMPGMNGLDVQKRLIQESRRLPVVVITGHDEPQTRAQCLAAGATAYLRKPIDDQALLAAIYRATGVDP